MSSGWVWLVSNGQRGLAVIPTFGAGTMLVRSHKIQGLEQHTVVRQIIGGGNSTHSLGAGSTHNRVAPSLPNGPSVTSPMSGVTSSSPPLNPHTPARSLHSTSAVMSRSVFGTDTNSDPDDEKKTYHNLVNTPVYPLFCISVYEHAWLSSGYGVWGKEKYVENFFSAVHWGKASQTYDKFNAHSTYLL